MIHVTEKAAKEIQRLQTTDPQTTSGMLRVMVVGGGCSGMSYKLDFEKGNPNGNDKIFEELGVKLVVDPKSLLFLSGMTLDFSDGLNGTGFTFNNPNAKRTCGCGSSFSA
jgi:iron-sulfur cluster assembly protein